MLLPVPISGIQPLLTSPLLPYRPVQQPPHHAPASTSASHNLVFTCSQRGSARTYIISRLTSAESLQVAPRSLLWAQGSTGPGLHCLADPITHPSLSLTLPQPISFLTTPQTHQPDSSPGHLHWLFSLPEALFLHKSPDPLPYLLGVFTSVLSGTLTTIPPHGPSPFPALYIGPHLLPPGSVCLLLFHFLC